MAKKPECNLKVSSYTSGNVTTPVATKSSSIPTGILNPDSVFYVAPPSSVSPEKDCPICRGGGSMRNPENPLEFQTCECVEKKKIQRYLTPTYAGAARIPFESFKTEMYYRKNILIHNLAQNIYQSIVKSFLLYTGYKHSHLTVSGHDILDAYFKQFEQNALQPLLNVEYLFIYLCVDPINKQYSANIPSLFEKRRQSGLFTWVYTNKEINSEPFKRIYSSELVEFILTNFQTPGK